ncbi:M20/M25/M40 family metallo-hydrolase [Pseudoduganella violaceinigra]|uniref:M20/M25/M40 family metallo-hydrolase n=1 Tax=Pseudoduganella violaceinigra TaxID=246602 RepID=UPI0012B5C7FB|nr:M20/M25/M40 family metallo-hydrolase [Pseudoduganella violaceinigra]
MARFLTILLALLASGAYAADAPPPAQALIDEIAARSEMQRNLEELCDDIGPRMTGTRGLQNAQEWAMRKLAAYGASNVHLEAYDLGRPWQRGAAHARLLNANGMHLNVLQKAWTEGTRGTIRADVALLSARTMDDFNAALPRLKEKIVLAEQTPREAPRQALREAGVAAVLQVSGKSDGLQDMWGGPGQRYDSNAGIITGEHAALLRRLLARGITPRMELTLRGGFAVRPVKAHNVIADFPGSEADGDMVILGAHLDSWDLSSGANDNGAGVVTMLEVLRAMRAAGLKPRRSLRIVLFSGEEQGLLGSKAYVAAHAGELSRIQAVLVQDAGSGRILAFPDMEVEGWYGPLNSALAPAKVLGDIDVHYAKGLGSDQESFFKQGIPAFSPLQDSRNYRTHTQHSEIDTLDHIDHAGLQQAAQVTAILAWGLLNGERLPR